MSEVSPAMISAAVVSISGVLGMGLWLGAIQARVAAHSDRLNKLERIAEETLAIRADVRSALIGLQDMRDEIKLHRGV